MSRRALAAGSEMVFIPPKTCVYVAYVYAIFILIFKFQFQFGRGSDRFQAGAGPAPLVRKGEGAPMDY